MSRKAPKYKTIKALLTRSGNECAFPDCKHPIINEKHKLIAQLCHIEAANKGGERFNPKQTDEERRSYENLMFMCYRHHVESNDVAEFTVEKLRKIKLKHESKFSGKSFKIHNEEIIKGIQEDINRYWLELKFVHKENDYPDDLKMSFDFDKNIEELFLDLRSNIKGYNHLISILYDSGEKLNQDFIKVVKQIDFFNIVSKRIEKLPYYKNPFVRRNWEFFNIEYPNLSSNTEILVNQLEVKIIEGQLINDIENQNLKSKLMRLKKELKEQVGNAGLID